MNNLLQTYKISIDEVEEGIDMIAVTANPAIAIKGVKLSAIEQEDVAAVMKFESAERQIIAGPALIPNKKIYRKDEDGEYNVMFTEQVIHQLVERFAQKTLSKINVFNDEHKSVEAPMFILEHWIVEDPEMDKSRTFGFENLPKGTWFVMAKVTDQNFWETEVKGNDKYGFSIEGLLGLKLNTKQNMSEKKKFENALLGDGTRVYAEKFEVGNEAYVIDENGDKAPIFDGEHVMEDGRTVVTVAGKITEIKTKAETEEMAEVTEEVQVEETLAEEVVVETPVEVEAKPSLTEEDVLKMIQPKLDEIYAVIAELKSLLVEEESIEVETEMSKVEQLAAKLQRMSEYGK
jgi:hypothetical protein